MTGLFSKESKWKVEVIIPIKNEVGMLVFSTFGSRGKPIRGHFSERTPFSYSWLSSDSHYVAERLAGQWLEALYYKGVYCTSRVHIVDIALFEVRGVLPSRSS